MTDTTDPRAELAEIGDDATLRFIFGALSDALDRAEKAEAERDDLAMALRAEQETALLSPEIKQALADQSSHAAGYAQGVQAVVDACDMVKVVSVCGSGQVYESGFQAGANRCHEEALALLPADTPWAREDFDPYGDGNGPCP